MQHDQLVKNNEESVVPKLRNDPLFRAFFFSNLTDALFLLEQRLLSVPPISETKLISPFLDIIGKQANYFAEELLSVLSRPSPSQEHFHPLPVSDAHESLLIVCIWLRLPNLFKAIFIRLEGFSTQMIKECYLLALQKREYGVFETLQPFSPPTDLIRLAFSASLPERVITLLWQSLEEARKPYVLREILKGFSVSDEGIDIKKLPDPFRTYYKQNSNLVAIDFEEKELNPSQKIVLSDLLLPTEAFGLSQLSSFIIEKKFTAFFLAMKKGAEVYGDEYFFRLIAEHLLATTDDESKSENSKIQTGIRFLQLIKNTSDLGVMHFLLKHSQIYSEKTYGLIFSLIYSNQYYDLPAQFLVKQLLKRECLSAPEEKFLRTLIFFNKQHISPPSDHKLQIKLSTLFDGGILPFEQNEIYSRIKTIAPSNDHELEFKLLFPKSTGFSQQALMNILPSTLWQLVGGYLTSADIEENNWYNQFISCFPIASPLNFTQKQITKLQSYIAKIEEFQQEIIALQESKHPLIKRNKLYRILCLAIMFLEAAGVTGLSMGIHLIKLSRSRQRHALLDSPDWQSCPSSGFHIYDYSASTAPSYSRADCENSSNGAYSVCNQICDSFNSLQHSSSSLRIGLIIGIVVLLIILMTTCAYSDGVFAVNSLDVFNLIRSKIEIFYRTQLNKSNLPQKPNDLYNDLEDEKLRINEQIPLLHRSPQHHALTIRPSHNGYTLLPGGDEDEKKHSRKSVSNPSSSNDGLTIN